MVLLVSVWSFSIMSFSLFILLRLTYFLNLVFHNLCLINPISEIFVSLILPSAVFPGPGSYCLVSLYVVTKKTKKL